MCRNSLIPIKLPEDNPKDGGSGVLRKRLGSYDEIKLEILEKNVLKK